MIKNLKIIIILFYTFNLTAQNPRELLNQVKIKLNKINDYKADINIKVDLPYISINPIDTKLYFKQKDKFKLDTKRIAVLPKQGFLELNKLVNDTVNFLAIFQTSEIINKTKTSLINLIPINDTSDIILAKIWVDHVSHVIIKSQITTKSNGTIKIEYAYGSQIDYGLPTSIKFIVDIKKFKLPKALSGDIHVSRSRKVEKHTGEICVTFKNYEINKGISNSIFIK